MISKHTKMLLYKIYHAFIFLIRQELYTQIIITLCVFVLGMRYSEGLFSLGIRELLLNYPRYSRAWCPCWCTSACKKMKINQCERMLDTSVPCLLYSRKHQIIVLESNRDMLYNQINLINPIFCAWTVKKNSASNRN